MKNSKSSKRHSNPKGRQAQRGQQSRRGEGNAQVDEGLLNHGQGDNVDWKPDRSKS